MNRVKKIPLSFKVRALIQKKPRGRCEERRRVEGG
jgi:hypothetical protein